MKIVKTRVNFIPQNGAIKYIYPHGIDHTKVKWVGREPIADVAVMGNDYGYLIGVVSDDNLASFLALDDTVEVSKEDAITEGSVWHPQIEQLTNLPKVTVILAKIAREEVLTQKEIDALDPTNAETGVNLSATFSKKLADHGV